MAGWKDAAIGAAMGVGQGLMMNAFKPDKTAAPPPPENRVERKGTMEGACVLKGGLWNAAAGVCLDLSTGEEILLGVGAPASPPTVGRRSDPLNPGIVPSAADLFRGQPRS